MASLNETHLNNFEIHFYACQSECECCQAIGPPSSGGCGNNMHDPTGQKLFGQSLSWSGFTKQENGWLHESTARYVPSINNVCTGQTVTSAPEKHEREDKSDSFLRQESTHKYVSFIQGAPRVTTHQYQWSKHSQLPTKRRREIQKAGKLPN